MPFNHTEQITIMRAHWATTKIVLNDSLYLADPPKIKLAQGAPGTFAWRIIGIHHLTPDENRGNRNAFLGVLTGQGTRLFPAWAGWTWEGRQPHERADPVPLDKPNAEPPGNISIGSNQKITVWSMGSTNPAAQGTLSDEIYNVHTLHPDERGPNGELWNSIGHHSFFIVWQLDTIGSVPPPITDPGPAPGPNVKTFEHSWSQPGLRGYIKIEVDKW